jgi:phosphatidylglycerol---prolipoprotein diacylglyceryl transferase
VFPTLVDLGFLRVPMYGVLLVTGVALGLWTAYRRARLTGLPGERVVDFGLWVVLWGLLGAKAMLVITEPAYLGSPQALLALFRAGGVFYGGLIAAVVTAVVLLRRYGLRFAPTTDVLAPSVALAHVFGRLGCFAAGCCYGAACDKPWGVIFSHPLAAEISGTPLGVPLHPTQLYEAAFNLANYAFLAWLFRRRPAAGSVLGAYLVTYGTGRFLLEFLRGDPDRGFILGGSLSTSQGIAAVMVPLGIGILVWAWRKKTGDRGRGTGDSEASGGKRP